ncbi:hypothetical protein O181_037916 [Austropuccinia psidii MF-1]|uniref:Uncharacterized protein n=1 Tax=Austropuccinia psidii MF-1 TaxID=1389203 RepID=A0A9Q3DD17_9BASI|nr:hypothetical protein [Austropuccinia psidii MF-1]
MGLNAGCTLKVCFASAKSTDLHYPSTELRAPPRPQRSNLSRRLVMKTLLLKASNHQISNFQEGRLEVPYLVKFFIPSEKLSEDTFLKHSNDTVPPGESFSEASRPT